MINTSYLRQSDDTHLSGNFECRMQGFRDTLDNQVFREVREHREVVVLQDTLVLRDHLVNKALQALQETPAHQVKPTTDCC